MRAANQPLAASPSGTPVVNSDGNANVPTNDAPSQSTNMTEHQDPA